MMASFLFRISRLMAAVWFIVYILGCSDQGASDAVESTTKPSIQFAQLPISYSAVTQLAHLRGSYETAGVDVRIVSVPAGPDIVAALRSPTAAAGAIAVTPIVTMIAAGDEPVILATTLLSNHQVKLVTFESTGISEDPLTLHGMRVGIVKGTIGEIYFDRLLAKGGLDREALTVVNGRPADLRNLLVQGELDAAVLWTPFTTQAVRNYRAGVRASRVTWRGEPLVLVDPTLATLAFNVVTTKNKLVEHRDALSRMLLGLIDAEQFISDEPDEAQRLLENWLKLESGDLDDLFDTTQFRVHLNVADMQRWIAEELEWYATTRMDTRIPTDFSRYIDSSLLEQIAPDRVE